MSIIEEAQHEKDRAWPVRAVVMRNATEILQAREAGISLAAIYRVLVRRGEAVGKGPSSFRAAIRFLDQHGWPKSTSVTAVAGCFADPRFKNDF